jgi:hypothetical protein
MKIQNDFSFYFEDSDDVPPVDGSNIGDTSTSTSTSEERLQQHKEERRHPPEIIPTV